MIFLPKQVINKKVLLFQNDVLLKVDEDELELPRDLSGLEVQLGRVASVAFEVWREKAKATAALEAGIAKSNQMLKKNRTKIFDE
jgi:hypothetical protein